MVGVTYTQTQLDAMGLSPAEQTDEIIGQGSYQRRLQLQNAVKTTNQAGVNLLGDVIFATKPAAHTKSARCNFPGAGAGGADLNIAPDTYIFLDENKAWSAKYLTFSKGQTKDTQG